MKLRSRRKKEDTEINMTPMLDVVFIMLIFFIVTATFVKEIGLDANKPPDQEVTTDSSDSITLIICANDDILLDGLRIDKRAVSAQIVRRKAENPKAAVAVLAHPKSKADTLVSVVNSVKEAGIRESVPVNQSTSGC